MIIKVKYLFLKILILTVFIVAFLFIFPSVVIADSCYTPIPVVSVSDATLNPYNINVLDNYNGSINLTVDNSSIDLSSSMSLIVDIFPSGPWGEPFSYTYNTSMTDINIPNTVSNAMYKVDIYYKCLSSSDTGEPVSFMVSTGDPTPISPLNLTVNGWWKKLYSDESIKLSWKDSGKYIYDVSYKYIGDDSWERLGITWDNFISFKPPRSGNFEWRVRSINGPYISEYSYSKFKVFSKYQKYPIVFVNGWSGSSFESSGICDSPNPPDYFENLDDDFIHSGFNVYYADLVTSPCGTPSLYVNAKLLKLSIEKAKRETGSDKVILITHSMGGLVARSYMEGPNYNDDVSLFFALGVPNKGVPLSSLLTVLGIPSFTPTLCVTQPAICEMTGGGMLLFNKIYKKPNDISYHLISGTGDDLNLLGKLSSSFMLGIPNDGLIPLYSGLGISNVDQFITDENHNILGPNNYFHTRNDGYQSQTFTSCLKPLLIDNVIDNCGITFNPNDDYNASSDDFTLKSSLSNVVRGEHANIHVSVIGDNSNIPDNLNAIFHFKDNHSITVSLTKESDDSYVGSVLVPLSVNPGLAYAEIFDDNNFLSSFTFIVPEESISLTGDSHVLVNLKNNTITVTLGVTINDPSVKSFLFIANLLNNEGSTIQSILYEGIVEDSLDEIDLVFKNIPNIHDVRIQGLSDMVLVNTTSIETPVSIPSSISFSESSFSYDGLFSETVRVRNAEMSLLF